MSHQLIKIQGLSGCDINVVKTADGAYILEKSALGNYCPRLQLQMAKQTDFRTFNKLSAVHAPKVLYSRKITREDDDGKGTGVLQEITFGMEYEHNSDCIDYLNTCRVDALQQFCDGVVDVLKQNVEVSPVTPVPAKIFQDKYKDVLRILAKNTLVTSDEYEFIKVHCSPYFDNLEQTISLPLGKCHGDLTLSNILIQRPSNRIILIDFLDSFVESPLADMVKLRQDTRFGWSILLSKARYDPVRMACTLKYVDNAIVSLCSEYEWFRKYNVMMQLMNQLRVLQYATKDRVIVDHLLGSIHAILKD